MFEVGDRVRAVTDVDGNTSCYSGLCGTVVFVNYDKWIAGVEWDELITQGHTCDGHCRPGYGWKAKFDEIELCEKEVENYKKIRGLDKKLAALFSAE